MEKTYPLWQGLYRAFFSKAFYRDAAQRWRWGLLGYLFLLAAIVWILVVIRLAINFNYLSEVVVHSVAKQMPVVRIKNNQAFTNKPGPYRINLPGTKKTFAIIATQSNEKSHFKQSQAVILVSKDAVYTKTGKQNKLTKHSYDSSWQKLVSPEKLVKFYKQERHKTLIAVALTLYLVGVVFFFLFCLAYIVVLSVFLSMISGYLEIPVTSRHKLVLSVLSMTPALILFALLYLVGWASALTLILLFIVQFVYLIMAVSFMKKTTDQKAG